MSNPVFLQNEWDKLQRWHRGYMARMERQRRLRLERRRRMKRLRDMRLLDGQEEVITVTDFRFAPGDVLDQVEQGKVFTVTRQGKPIATIRSPEPNALELGAAVRRAGLA